MDPLPLQSSPKPGDIQPITDAMPALSGPTGPSSSADTAVTARSIAGPTDIQRASAQIFKWERGTAGMSSAEAKRRVLDIQRDIRAASAQSRQGSSAGLFKAACSTDLLFLIDTTGSMGAHIDAAKEQVKGIVDDISSMFLDEANVRMAVVGYKDHGDDPNIEFLDFTTSAEEVRSFVSKLNAIGGGDAPEDVLGGIQQALNASWKQQTRCIIHIADAPPHGRTLHDERARDDTYATPGSEPHRLTHRPLLQRMIKFHINYALLRINETTDRMAYNFLLAYNAVSTDCKLLQSNKYYDQACKVAHRSSGRLYSRGLKGPSFEEMQLGTSLSEMQHLVVNAVSSSVSRTANRLSTAKTLEGMEMSLKLDSIAEDEDEKGPRLEVVVPKWNKPGWFDQTFVVQGFSPDVAMHGGSTLDDMMADDDNITMSVTELTIHKRSRPFAQGAFRVAAYAQTACSTDRFVVKSFKRDGKRLAHLAEDMRIQALCKAFALEFNALVEERHSLDFIVTTCLQVKDGQRGTTTEDECMSLEPFIEGAYMKYNSNRGYVNKAVDCDSNDAAQAFSHFTYERSRGLFLVTDMQGVGNMLTDPAIQTKDTTRFQLSDTNINSEGFKFFFVSHKCNAVCTKLGLKSNAQMLVSGSFEFREEWPRLDDTVCCSNKLCGRILYLSSAKSTSKFPGYHWCRDCYPQLFSSLVTLTCAGPGGTHKFEISRFFYESQGYKAPQTCPEHYDEKTSVPAVRMGKMKMFNRFMRSAFCF